MSDIKIYYPQGEQKNIVIEGMSSDNENNDVISEDIQQNKVFSVTYQYYGTNNKQEIPDGTEVGWSAQIPNKTYLWIRTVKRYNNGTITVSNPSPDRNSQYPIDQSSTTVPSDLSRPTPNPVITDEVDDVIGLQVEDLQNQDVSNLISEGQSDNYLQNETFLSQTEVFNALTDNGQAQGLYRAKDKNGKDQIYLNMTYARSGILQVGGSNNELGAFQVLDKDNQIIGYWDKNGIVLTEGEIKSADNSSSWNLKTGELVLNGYVMSYQVEYAIGDSKSTAPQTGWSQNAPAEVEDGKYLWQKSTLVRTGQPTRVTTVCLGKNGIDGTNGRGISSAAVEYCISSSVTDPSGDGVWSEAAPAYQENKYYWTRTRITYTDGITEYSDPALDLALTDANRIAANASAIADVAQRAADQAKADAATAKQNAASAVADAATAKQNAASAVADAAQAKEAANQAQIDADAAAASASSAQTSASNAATSASSAQTSASNAATSASSAQASATSAAEDAAAAREDADDAQSSAEAAATSASSAQTSASNAATSAGQAQSSAAAAASSAQIAQSKAEASALSAQAAQNRANDAEAAATSAAENATSALDRAREAAASADSAQTAADNAATSAGDAATSASNAQTAAGNAATSASNAAADAATANQNAAAAVEDARTAKENAAAAKTDAATAKSNAEQAQRDATAANNAATGAVTSLGIVQGVVETLETDVDDLQTHVAMMDAITDEDDNVLVPSGLHVVSTENGYFIVLSNDGMYVYDPQSVLVATYGESISFNSARPQKVGGQDAYLEYYDSNNDGKADALRIVGNKVDITGGAKIYSNNYQASSNPTSPYSASGTFLDLTNGNLYMPNFGVDNVNGQAYINGEIIATGGKLGIDGSQNYWEIDTTKTDYNSNNFASIVGHGNAFIQIGQFQLSDNLFDTRSYDVQAKITYPKYDNTYWDFGIQAPTLNTAASGYVQGIDDNFLYIRNHANTIPSLKQDWNYVFRVDDNGNIYTTGQIYIDGHSLDEIYASQGSGSAYIAKNPVGTWDNTISGNLKVTGSIDGTATKATQLTHWISINGTQWDGSSNLTLGTLNVQYGGTGATTFTAGAALIGNGTGAIQTRTITNNTSSTYVLGSTNLITANTVKYFNGAYDSSHNSNLEYVKHGKLGTIVTHDIDEFITVNGGIIDGSLQVTDLTAGNLVVTGVGRFTNGIYGDLTGNASTANKVNHDLVIQLNGGTTEGTNKFTFNGSAAKTVNVTPSSIGLGNVNNTADSAKNVLTATKFSSARTIALTGDVTGSASADGSSGWSITTTVKDNSHNHTFDNLKPLIKKTYASTSYYATSANSWETSTWYFMSVKPDGWYKPWTVKFKVHTFLPTHENIESISYCTISGRADSLIYSFWNESYYSAHYYIGYYALKQTGFNAGLGHAIGVSILYGTSYTDASYYRTFDIEYYECENCSVTILDTPVKWANWNGTGSTNYNGIGSMNMAGRGLQETGDSDTLEDRLPYFAVKTGTKGIWAGSLFMRTGTGTYENICTASDGTVTSSNRTTATTKIANTTGFAVGSEVFYSNTSYNANTNINGYGVVYNTVSAFDSRYAINSTLTNNFLTPYEPIYLVGTIGSDGLFYFDPVWWTQSANVAGKIYILVGGVYDSNTSNCRISLYQHNHWYYYDGSKLVEYVSKATTADTADHLTTTRSFTIGKTAKNVDWSSAVSFSKAEISDNASGSAAGWMSSAHYTKLEGIEAGAQVNTITGVKGNSESNYRTGNVNITAANIGLGNLTNDKQVKGLASGTTAGHFVTWGANGYTVADSGYTAGQIVKTLASNNDGKIVLTYLDGTTSDPIEVKIIGSSSSSVSYADALNVNGTAVGSATQPVFINAQGKPQTANSIPKLNNGTTGGTFYAPTAAGTSGQYLKSSGSGAPTWETFSKSTVGLGNVANIDQSKAIKSITKSGSTYTMTALDNTTSTFSSHITGIKGDMETNYRSGNVNLTSQNIGAIPYNETLFTTNTFAPAEKRSLYISKIDNAFFALDKRYSVTVTYDGQNVSNVAQFFDGNYEGYSLHIENNKTAVFTIDFSSGSGSKFSGFPYGYIYISFYNRNIPKTITGRIYNNYESQGTGWHDLTFEKYTNSIYRARQSYYGLQTLEITMVGSNDTPQGYTSPNEIEMHLNRPDPYNHNPIVTKYCEQKLYYNITAPKFIGALQGNADTATKATQDASGNTITSTYAKLSGATFTGAVNFANGTLNKIGDDCYLGDQNVAGCICIKGVNGATGINFMPYSGSTAQKISIDGAGTMTITGTVAGTFSGNLSGNATTATTATSVATQGNGTTNVNRHVWFSDSSTETKRAHDDDFMYNPSTNTLTVENVNGSATSSFYPKIVAANEIRFDAATKPSTATTLVIGHKWSDGTSDAKINGYEFRNGNGEKADLYAATFYGNLSGNATSATKATQDGNGAVISDTYLKLSGGTMTGTIMLPVSTRSLRFRPETSQYDTAFVYGTNGNEALALVNQNAVTSFMIVHGSDPETWNTASWTSAAPTIQTKNKSLYVNELIGSGTTPVYNFKVNGASYLGGDVKISNSNADTESVKLSYDANLKCLNFQFAS